ncbi:caspase family protein [Aulosira sp. FACHB-615]|uniref:nSTAND1 domain-containing NTPase n=1 Tax=Aulosira sp. FACHB-615 TaxID=2692777 RepID=UPI001682CD91|nr:caspase family protein [Aulosira sp. FACHB-615]MBD2492295.1 caspase family protein [Aulosira sp. FACHB-615]
MSKSKYDFHRNLAIIIGINNYSNGIPELETPVADAEKLAKILQENYQYEVQILLNEKATLLQLTSLLTDLKQKTLHLPDKTLQIEESDRLIFYFAGHGIVPADGLENRDNLAGYLVPQDARGDILLQKQIEINKILLPMPDLHNALVELPCRHLLVILDCCFAGAFRSSLYREILPARKVYKQRYDRFIRDRAWQAIASAAHDQKAIDYLGCFGQRGTTEDNKHSPFAEALFAGLRGAADTIGTGDGIITATELYCYVRDQVEELTDELDKRQTPGLFPLKKHDKGEYIFLLPNFEQNKLEDAPALNEENNPYRGLKSYEEQHSQLFFGRDELIKQLYERVLHPKNPLTVVLGVSGSGKSSLVKAGLIPYIKANHNEDWYIIPTFRPGESPFATLAEVIAINTKVSESKIEVIKSLSQTLIQAPRQFIEIVANGRQIATNAKLLLVIDQFEELITICKQQEREQFLNFLAEVLEANAQRLHIIITLRSDFEPRFLDSALKPYWSGDRFPVRAMRSDELRQAIERPANEKMLDFDPPNLVDLLIDEVGQMPGSLSLLSFTLSELYTKCIERESRTLTQVDYQELGGVAGSLTHRATEIHNKLDKAQQLTMQRVMLRMVTIEGGESARRRVPLSELIYIHDVENERVEEICQRLDKARLIVGGQEPGGEPYVEPAHDALVKGWARLKEWIDNELDEFVLRQRLTAATNDWIKNPQDSSLLLPNGDRLNQLEKILRSEKSWFNQQEAEFVERSIQQKREQERQNLEKDIELKIKESQRLFTANDRLDAIDNMIEAGHLLQKNNLRIAKDKELYFMIIFNYFLSETREINSINIRDKVNNFSCNKEAQVIATVSGETNKTISLYNLQEKRIDSKENKEQIFDLAFSADGKTLVAGGEGGLVKFYNNDFNTWHSLDNVLDNVKKHMGIVESVTFSLDNNILVSAGSDKKIIFWVGKSFAPTILIEHNYPVKQVVFNPKDNIIAFTQYSLDNKVPKDIINIIEYQISSEGIYQIYPGNIQSLNSRKGGYFGLKRLLSGKYSDNKYPPIYTGLVEGITAIDFSPDGKFLVVGGWKGELQIWSISKDKKHKMLKVGQDEEAISYVAFSPNGKIVASSHTNGLINLWDTSMITSDSYFELQKIQSLAGHKKAITKICFTLNLKNPQLLSSSHDGSVKIWSLRDIFEPYMGKTIRKISFSANNQIITTVDEIGNMRFWKSNGEALNIPFDNKSEICNTQLSRCNEIVMNVTSVGEVMVNWYNLNETIVGASIQKPIDRPLTLNFSPNGNSFIIANENNTIGLWEINVDTRNVSLLDILKEEPQKIKAITFNSTGRFFVLGRNDANGEVNLCKIEANQGVQEISKISNVGGSIVCLSLNDDAEMIGVVINSKTEGYKIKLYCRLNDSLIERWCSVPTNKITALKFYDESKIVVSIDEAGCIDIWNIELTKELCFEKTALKQQEPKFKHTLKKNVEAATFSSNGEEIAIAIRLNMRDDSYRIIQTLTLNLDNLVKAAMDRKDCTRV